MVITTHRRDGIGNLWRGASPVKQLLLEMQPFVPMARCDVLRLLGELRSAAAEVEPLCGAQTAGFEELDDEI